MDLRRQHFPVHIAGLMLFGKQNRHAQGDAGRRRNGDAARLDGQDLGHTAIRKQARDLLTDFLQKAGVDLLVEKVSYFENPARKDTAFPEDLFFHCAHVRFPFKTCLAAAPQAP